MLAHCHAAELALAATGGLHPNLAGHIAQPLRYHPDGEDFVIHNGGEFFNRSLYGGHSAFRVDGGDKPEFLLYLPGRGGNLRLAVRTPAGSIWLHEAHAIVTRYRPGELHYEIRDPLLGEHGSLTLAALAYTATEGLVLRAEGHALPAGTELVWAYGGVNGVRGKRDGDIGTESVPISEYFQFKSAYAEGNRIALDDAGFTLSSPAATIGAVVPAGATQWLADGAAWNDLPTLLGAPAAPPRAPIAAGRVLLRPGGSVLLSLQRTEGGAPAADPATYREVSGSGGCKVAAALPARYARAALPEMVAHTLGDIEAVRRRIVIATPDPYLDAAAGALNVVADALWDDCAQAIMHGAIAWRTKLLGWRGPYALDALGWHERARANFATWTARQNTAPVPAQLPPADTASNLARNEAGLHSNGDLSGSHYDMNLVFIDALLRHLLWTGDLDYARAVWPVIGRHLAWEQRLFRREIGPDKLPLYEAYAAIWASDDLYYGGGGTTHASAYNYYANRSAARLARLLGKDGGAYDHEADLIALAMRTYLWMPERGAFGEYRDLLGLQRLHPSYALWTFYHTIDAQLPDPQEAQRLADDLARQFKPIPVTGPGVPDDAAYHVLASSDWMPYSWSINNVVMGENLHTALALWQAGSAEDAFVLAKGALLASMYMGISPGNVGTMNYLDVYRRESQRDFADGAGVLARTLVEGLFGVQPDALARTLRWRPGFPAAWTHASLRHPDLGMAFERHGKTEQWRVTQPLARFGHLSLRVPAAYSRVKRITVNGVAAVWRADQRAGARPALLIETAMGRRTEVSITWAGEPVATPAATAWAPERAAPAQLDWRAPRTGAGFTQIDLSGVFNDSVNAIFKPGKYLAPRSPYVSLSIPAQGSGAWAGHLNELPDIDDSGVRGVAAHHGGVLTMPNGVPFATPGGAHAPNIVLTSRWSNYPAQLTIALCGSASHAWLLMAGSTNFMQSRLDNGDISVVYADGSTQRLALVNPSNWWPIEQDYLIDDYQFERPGATPPRVDLKTGRIRLDGEANAGQRIAGGAATALELKLDPAKLLRGLTLRTLSNDIVIGLMSLTLERPAMAGAQPQDCPATRP